MNNKFPTNISLNDSWFEWEYGKFKMKPNYTINNQEDLIELYCSDCENHIQSIPYKRNVSVGIQLLGRLLLCGKCLPKG